MKVTEFSKLADISVATARRWVSLYEPFLTPSATPPKGETRVLSPHDQRVLYYAAQLRDAGLSSDVIVERLKQMQADDWHGLVELPPEWNNSDGTMPVSLAASRASEVAQVAVLQNEHQHIRQALQLAEGRMRELEEKLQSTEADKSALTGEKHTLEVELAQTKGEVSRLEAELKAYGMAYSLGGSKPVSVVWIIAATALIATIIVIVAFVVAILAT